MPNPQGYVNIEKQYRKRYLELLQQFERDYVELLDRFMERLNRVIGDYTDNEGKFTTAVMDDLKEEMDALSYWLGSETREMLDDYIVQSASLAVEGQDAATEYFIRDLIDEVEEEEQEILIRALEGVESEEGE